MNNENNNGINNQFGMQNSNNIMNQNNAIQQQSNPQIINNQIGMQNPNNNVQPQSQTIQPTISYQGNDDKIKKYNKILIITNIITILLLILFIILFILTSNRNDTNKVNNTDLNDDNSYTSTATTKEVSKDWKDYQFGINGKTLALPCSYKELKAISGFSMKSSDEKSYIQRNYSVDSNLYIGDPETKKLAAYIELKNNTSEDLKYSDAEVVRIYQTAYSVETSGAEAVVFPGNLKVTMEITPEQIKSMFGEPTKIRDNLSQYDEITLIYNNDSEYTTVNYYEIVIRKGKIDSLTIDHKKY